MAQFKSLAAIQAHLEKTMLETMNRSAQIERVLANEMSDAVRKIVYDAYEPEEYVRREEDGGLADERNMSITNVSVINKGVQLIFENLTQGQTHQLPIYDRDRDSLDGQFITDTIVEGLKSNWCVPGGEFSEPRDFVAETIRRLKENPTDLSNAIRSGLIARGIKVK